MNENKNLKTGKYIGTLYKKINKDILLKELSQNNTIKNIAKIFSISPEGLRKFIIKNNISYKKKIKYKSDDNFFDKNTELAFYWAGFIAADGNISKKSDFTLALKISDSNHLEKFKDNVSCNAPITFTHPKQKIINNVKTMSSGAAFLRFRNKYWIHSLYKFNIIPNKTKTYNIPEWLSHHCLFKHFIRGYFDGDGWFSIKKSNKLRLAFGLCGNYQVLQVIHSYLKLNCDIESLPCIYKQKNIFKFEFQKQHDILKIVKHLYNDATIFLDRKYEIANLAIKFDSETIILNIPKNKLIDSYNRLKSYKLMANEFNCAKSTIAKYMKKYNLTKKV